jgi:hypothetical protein
MMISQMNKAERKRKVEQNEDHLLTNPQHLLIQLNWHKDLKLKNERSSCLQQIWLMQLLMQWKSILCNPSLCITVSIQAQLAIYAVAYQMFHNLLDGQVLWKAIQDS